MCHRCHFIYDGVTDMLRTLDRSHLVGNTHAKGSGKLSDEDAEGLRTLLAQGVGLRAAARAFGISHTSAAKIRDRKTHV